MNGGRYDVLLVEDNPGDVRIVREAFEAFDREVRAVEDGETALDRLRAISNGEAPEPRLVLLDLHLPDTTGVEVLRTLECEGGFPVPVVVMTDSRSEADVREVYDANANAYLVKPVDFSEYSALVESIERFWLRSVRLPNPE